MRPEEFAYIGKSVPKIDARDKASGKSRYVQDILLPGMLYAKIKRSIVPSAKIKAIDTSRARSLAGVKAVLTGKDIPDLVFGFGADRRALQKDVVRCAGDEIAAVAAVDETTASAAIELISVEYEEVPAIFDPRAAIGSTTLVHDDKKSNVFKEYNYSHGDVKSALACCAVTAAGDYTYLIRRIAVCRRLG